MPTHPTSEELLAAPGLDAEAPAAVALSAEAGDGTGPVAPAEPLPEPARPRRAASGRYRGRGRSHDLELRVDVEGPRPLGRLSGDFFATTGATTAHFGSWVVEDPKLTRSPSELVAEGRGRFTWTAAAPVVRVTIPLGASSFGAG